MQTITKDYLRLLLLSIKNKVSTFILELFSIEKKVFYFLAGAAITQVLSIHYGMWFFGVPPFLVFSLIAIPLTVHALKKAFPTTLNFSYRHNVNIFFLCACSFLAILKYQLLF